MMAVMRMFKLLLQAWGHGIFLIFLFLTLATGFSAPTNADSDRHFSRHRSDFHQKHSGNMNDRRLWADNHRRRHRSSDDQDRLRRNYREWQSLPPENRKELRHRMEQWRRLSPEERNLYQKRYRQFEQLTPDQRGRVREKLDRWDHLSPQERDELRHTFPRR